MVIDLQPVKSLILKYPIFNLNKKDCLKTVLLFLHLYSLQPYFLKM